MRPFLFMALALICSSPVAAKSASFRLIATLPASELNRTARADLGAILATARPGPGYQMPVLREAQYSVKIYEVQYESLIPEAGNRPIMASGILAIPVLPALRPLPLLAYQHGNFIDKQAAPSRAFAPRPQRAQGSAGAEDTRLVIAQFAGHGFAVMAADNFGFGSSSHQPEALFVKAATQQASFDLYVDVRQYLNTRGNAVTDVFLGGWSVGAVATMGLLQRLEREGVKVTGVFIAAGFNDPLASTASCIKVSQARGKCELPATLVTLAAFSIESYLGRPGLAASAIHPDHYDLAKRVYERNSTTSDEEYAALLSDMSRLDIRDLMRPELLDPVNFANSEFGKSLDDASTYRHPFRSPVRMYYGSNDELVSESIGRIPTLYQSTLVETTPDAAASSVIALKIRGGDQRLTFLAGLHDGAIWVDTLRYRPPTER